MKIKNTIVQLTNTGDFVAAFVNAKQANEATGIAYSTIRHSVNGRKTRNGYHFVEQNRKAMHNATRGVKRVSQRVDGTTVAVYANLNVAANMTGLPVDTIQSALNVDASVDGYTFNG